MWQTLHIYILYVLQLMKHTENANVSVIWIWIVLSIYP